VFSLTRRLRVLGLSVGLVGCGLALSGTALVVGPASASPDTGCVTTGGPVNFTVTCSVGTADTWTVPAGLEQATFAVAGAQGGSVAGQGTGGAGGELSATLTVSPGTTYDIEVGASGGNGVTTFSGPSDDAGGAPGGANSACFEQYADYQEYYQCGGGGGGASIVGLGGTAPSDWELVAGGGGGGGVDEAANGGNGGGLSGGTGGFEGGSGGTQSCSSAGQPNGGAPPGPAGGGGGGYCGGESGFANAQYGGGGGGSGFITPSAVSGMFQETTNAGAGSVVITYSATATSLTTRSRTTISGTFGDETVTFSATLSAGGSGVGDQTISFGPASGPPYCSAETNPSGVASCSASLPISVVFWKPRYTATFTGTTSYASSTATGRMSVVPANSAV
jgi:hypothetical protein